MRPLVFEWDQRKSALNKKKHGVSFDEARTVFLDPSAQMIADPDHSAEEDRFVMLDRECIPSARNVIGIRGTRRSRAMPSRKTG